MKTVGLRTGPVRGRQNRDGGLDGSRKGDSGIEDVTDKGSGLGDEGEGDGGLEDSVDRDRGLRNGGDMDRNISYIEMEGFREEDSRSGEGGEKTAGEYDRKETPGVGVGERQCGDDG
jgi:hypothetical protein